jgi:hypothetical protein
MAFSWLTGPQPRPIRRDSSNEISITFLTRQVGMICWMMARSSRPRTDSNGLSDSTDLDSEVIQNFGGQTIARAE